MKTTEKLLESFGLNSIDEVHTDECFVRFEPLWKTAVLDGNFSSSQLREIASRLDRMMEALPKEGA